MVVSCVEIADCKTPSCLHLWAQAGWFAKSGKTEKAECLIQLVDSSTTTQYLSPDNLGNFPGSHCFHLFQCLMHSEYHVLFNLSYCFMLKAMKSSEVLCSCTCRMVQHQWALLLENETQNSWRSELPTSILKHQSQKTGNPSVNDHSTIQYYTTL